MTSLCRSRPVSSVLSATSVVHNTSSFAGDQSQPIVISDTPSPAVSIITIHSDSEDEDDRKFSAAWWAARLLSLKFCLIWMLFAEMFHFLLQLWNEPEDQRDQLCDRPRFPWLWLVHQQSPEPKDHLSAHRQVHGHHHAVCAHSARGELSPQSCYRWEKTHMLYFKPAVSDFLHVNALLPQQVNKLMKCWFFILHNK